MAKTGIAEKVKNALDDIVTNMGYELVEVEYAKKVDGYNMTVYIDSPSGITLEDCEKVHRSIDGLLDELNPTNDAPYTLNVSSCGLDWPIVTDRDYQKNIGNVLDINLFAPIERKKTYTGTLVGFDENNIVIKDKSEQILPRKAIAKATRHIEF